jgi:hypothetical protein
MAVGTGFVSCMLAVLSRNKLLGSYFSQTLQGGVEVAFTYCKSCFFLGKVLGNTFSSAASSSSTRFQYSYGNWDFRGTIYTKLTKVSTFCNELLDLKAPKSHRFTNCFSYSFCIIEGPETIEDFSQLQSQEIQDNINSRRSKIFLLMEEVSNFSYFDVSVIWDFFYTNSIEFHNMTFLRLDDCECNSESELLKAKVPAVKKMKCQRYHQLFLSCLMRWTNNPQLICEKVYTLACKAVLSSIISSFRCPKQSPKTMKQLYMTSFSIISGIILFGGLIAPVVSSSFVYIGTP